MPASSVVSKSQEFHSVRSRKDKWMSSCSSSLPRASSSTQSSPEASSLDRDNIRRNRSTIDEGEPDITISKVEEISPEPNMPRTHASTPNAFKKRLTDLRRFVSKKLFRIHEKKKVEEIDLHSPLNEAAGSSKSSPEIIQPVKNDVQTIIPVKKRARKLFSIGSSDEESILSEPSPVVPCTSIDEENSDVEELDENRRVLLEVAKR
ncbi:hypothetical protein CEXT_773181 [Caerostris extrusa]|uniref:Uncharacterized protein n=1 Tax=Caerostris extrusa TaxID=172846 RepID=A0AAV4QJN5_CAEEX|nr:hypothetical protein CEXT_773181 [Caerostris extrusa]